MEAAVVSVVDLHLLVPFPSYLEAERESGPVRYGAPGGCGVPIVTSAARPVDANEPFAHDVERTMSGVLCEWCTGEHGADVWHATFTHAQVCWWVRDYEAQTYLSEQCARGLGLI